jgi:hypothetical protein
MTEWQILCEQEDGLWKTAISHATLEEARDAVIDCIRSGFRVTITNSDAFKLNLPKDVLCNCIIFGNDCGRIYVMYARVDAIEPRPFVDSLEGDLD